MRTMNSNGELKGYLLWYSPLQQQRCQQRRSALNQRFLVRGGTHEGKTAPARETAPDNLQPSSLFAGELNADAAGFRADAATRVATDETRAAQFVAARLGACTAILRDAHALAVFVHAGRTYRTKRGDAWVVRLGNAVADIG